MALRFPGSPIVIAALLIMVAAVTAASDSLTYSVTGCLGRWATRNDRQRRLG